MHLLALEGPFPSKAILEVLSLPLPLSVSFSLGLSVLFSLPPSVSWFLYLPLSYSFCFSFSSIYMYISSFPLTLPLAQSATATLASWLFFKHSKFTPISKPQDACPACLLPSFQSPLKCHLFREACSGLQILSLFSLFSNGTYHILTLYRLCLFPLPLCPQLLEHCLACNRHSLNIS